MSPVALNPVDAADQFLDSLLQAAQRPGLGYLAKAFRPLLRRRVLRKTQEVGVIVPPLENLQALPQDSLGHTLAQFLEKRQLRPLAFGPRRVQVHDVLHVLLSYDTDWLGEGKVQWFLMGAKPTPINWVLGLNLLRRTSAWSEFHQAYQRGKTSPLDPDTLPVEELWQLPLSLVRHLYRL